MTEDNDTSLTLRDANLKLREHLENTKSRSRGAALVST
jgi:hypothetical protein